MVGAGFGGVAGGWAEIAKANTERVTRERAIITYQNTKLGARSVAAARADPHGTRGVGRYWAIAGVLRDSGESGGTC